MTEPERHEMQWVCVFPDGKAWIYEDLGLEIKSPTFARILGALRVEARRRTAAGEIAQPVCRMRAAGEVVENELSETEYAACAEYAAQRFEKFQSYAQSMAS